MANATWVGMAGVNAGVPWPGLISFARFFLVTAGLIERAGMPLAVAAAIALALVLQRAWWTRLHRRRKQSYANVDWRSLTMPVLPTLRINRAPVLTLWGAGVAERSSVRVYVQKPAFLNARFCT